MIWFKQLSEKASAINSKISRKTWIWIGLSLAALPALRIFYVQEMLAALIGFSILFVVIYAAVLSIFLLIRASKPLIVWTRPRVGRALQWSAETAESALANPSWTKTLSARAKAAPDQFRSQRLRLNENCKKAYSRVVRFRLWAMPGVRRVSRWSAETARSIAQEAIASPAWAKATPLWAKTVPVWAKGVPHQFRSQRLRLNENYKTAYSRIGRLRPWAMPKVRRVARWSAETARSVAQEAIASPAWAKATPLWAKTVPGWARAVPHRLRSQQLRLNENCKTVYSQFARLRIRPSYIYRVSLQKGGAALTVGLRAHKKISNQLGNWLTKRVTYPDLIRLRSISRVGSLRSRAQARRPR